MCRSLYRCPDFVRESYHNIGVAHRPALCNPMSIVVARRLYGLQFSIVLPCKMWGALDVSKFVNSKHETEESNV